MTTNGGHEPVFCTVVPPHVLDKLSRAEDPVLAGAARKTLERDAFERTHRRLTTVIGAPGIAAPLGAEAGRPHRTIHDARHGTDLPGRKVRGEGEEPGRDATVNRAYAGLGATYELFWQSFARDSIDGNGLPLDATVHYDRDYNNAFWNGEQMVFGDGDGEIFLDFTIPIDVIGHELSHGVTQYTANLTYFGQPGALNESMSDVFGALIKQYTLGQTAAEADWLIGAGLLAPRVTGTALRSMKAPGTAYDDDVLGKDPQFSELLGSRGGRWRSFIRTRRFGNQFGWLCLKALRSERALAGRGPHRGRWGAGGVGTCVGAACRGFPRNPVESQRPEVVGSCSMLR
nr:M4 family metallopeptidase [Streptomyces sp. LBUM 1477]